MKTKHFIDNIDVSKCQYFVNMNCGEPAELCSCNKDMYGFNTDCRIAECNKNCYFKQLQKMNKITNKIYCIFEGDYLPSCHAVFDNETQAKQYKRIIDNFNGFDSVFIEEYEVNKVYQPITAKRIKFWNAVMWIKENKLHKKGEIEIFEGEEVVPLNFNLEFKKNIEKYYIEVTSYKSKEHAMEKVKESPHPTESEGVNE